MEIGNRIRQIRLDKNLKLSEFGAKIEISESHLSKIENLNRSVNDRLIKLITNEFNISEEWLRAGIGPMYNERPAVNREFMGAVARIAKQNEIEKADLVIAIEKMNREEISALRVLTKSIIEKSTQ